MPETYGRDDAGVSQISTGQASPTAAITAPPASSCRTARTRPRGATHSHAATMPGTTSSAAAIFVSKPSPTNAPDSISQLHRAVAAQAAIERPERRGDAEHEQRVRVVVARDRDA